jgi:hypothetical protein
VAWATLIFGDRWAKFEDVTTVTQRTDFLPARRLSPFRCRATKACYRWIQGELVKRQYLTCSRQDIGVVIRYLAKVSGYSHEYLDQTAAAISDTVATERLNAARKKLFQSINRRSKQAA